MTDLLVRLKHFREGAQQGYDTAGELLCEAEAEIVTLRQRIETMRSAENDHRLDFSPEGVVLQ